MATEVRANFMHVALVLSLGAAGTLIGCTLVLANTYKARLEHPKKMEQSLAVTGSARKRIHSDLAVWRISLSGSGEDLKSGYAALKSATEKVSKFLDGHKFTPQEIALGAITSQPKYAMDRRGNETREQVGYKLDRTFTVSCPRVEAVASAASEVTELIQDGLEVVSSAPEYYYTKIGDLKIEMIGEASKDARSRADQIVTQAGCGIGEVRTARMGVLQITCPESTEVKSEGIYDTSTIEKDVTAVVALSFALVNR
ncbi:MAG TPA: SIMPL domain-containing protein [Planctomycetota bacterium]|jgi:hypothetical protein